MHNLLLISALCNIRTTSKTISNDVNGPVIDYTTPSYKIISPNYYTPSPKGVLQLELLLSWYLLLVL